MEMADGIVINKADGDNIDKANMAASHFRNALHLFPPTASGWVPEVLTYSGYYAIGIEEVWDMIHRYIAYTKENNYFAQKRHEQAKYWMYESIHEMLHQAFYQHPQIIQQLPLIEPKVLHNELSSFVAARQTMQLFLDSKRGDE